MSATIKNLRDTEDVAAKHGFGDLQEARFPCKDLKAEATGLGYINVKPGQRQPFAHRHQDAEEIYVVLEGGGRVKIDDDVYDIAKLDAIRMAPGVARALEAGPDGLSVLAFGTRHEGDAEIIEGDFWAT